jgi:hypothetical protein
MTMTKKVSSKLHSRKPSRNIRHYSSKGDEWKNRKEMLLEEMKLGCKMPEVWWR